MTGDWRSLPVKPMAGAKNPPPITLPIVPSTDVVLSPEVLRQECFTEEADCHPWQRIVNAADPEHVHDREVMESCARCKAFRDFELRR